MKTYKVWPKIAMSASALACLVGLFLPWATAYGYGRSDSINVFDGLFNPTAWILIVCIIIIGIPALLGIFIDKSAMTKTAGILGIVTSLVAIGTILLVLVGYNGLISSATSSYGIQSNLGIGFYLSLASMIATFVFSILALKLKN